MARRFTWEYLLSAILFSAGLLVLTQAIGTVKQTEAAPHAYNSTWQATKLLGVQYWNNSSTPVKMFDIPIGIAEWQVKGTLDDTAFKETWSLPGGSNLRADLKLRTATDLQITNAENFVKSDWILGIHGPGLFSNYRLYVDSVQKFNQENSPQNASSCTSTRSGSGLPNWQNVCMSANGQYSFVFSTDLGAYSGPGFGDVFGVNTISPLHWDVVGTYCDTRTDLECQ